MIVGYVFFKTAEHSSTTPPVCAGTRLKGEPVPVLVQVCRGLFGLPIGLFFPLGIDYYIPTSSPFE